MESKDVTLQALQVNIQVSVSPFLSAVSHSYGYGLLDASAIVSLAQTWTSVGPQRKCVITMLCETKLVQYTHTQTHTHRQLTEVSQDPDYKCLHILQLSLKNMVKTNWS